MSIKKQDNFMAFDNFWLKIPAWQCCSGFSSSDMAIENFLVAALRSVVREPVGRHLNCGSRGGQSLSCPVNSLNVPADSASFSCDTRESCVCGVDRCLSIPAARCLCSSGRRPLLRYGAQQKSRELIRMAIGSVPSSPVHQS